MNLNTEQNLTVVTGLDRWTKYVIAGPGSGKTATLIGAVVHEMKRLEGPPLIITYTNAAADEIQTRLSRLTGKTDYWVGTLHAFCLQLLTKNHRYADLPAKLTVIDDSQKAQLLETILRDMGSKVSVKRVLNKLELEAEYDYGGGRLTTESLAVIQFYRELKRNGLLTFTSILKEAEKVIRVLSGAGNWEWPALFIDEYQDSSALDHLIYSAIPSSRKFFVGDPDQAIFGFRGGNVSLMVAEAAENPDTVHVLERNYRCAPEICAVAQAVISHNQDRVPKKTQSNITSAGVVQVHPCDTPAHELAYVQHAIQTELPNATVAVLARTNRLVEDFAPYLEAHGIAVAKREHFEAPQDWRRTKLLLSVLQNPFNDFSVYQLLIMDKGLDVADKTRNDAAIAMHSINEHLGCVFSDHVSKVPDLKTFGVSPLCRERVHDAARELGKFKSDWTINDLLLHLNRMDDARRETGTGITVTTIHAAKGREWDVVFIVGVEDETLPMRRKDTDLEEERRLFYVALTRARRRVVVTYCLTRPAPFGPQVQRECKMSPFIAEMGEQFLPRHLQTHSCEEEWTK